MKLVYTILYLSCLVLALCMIGCVNKVPLGEFDFIRNYGDLGFFLCCAIGFALLLHCDYSHMRRYK